MHDFVQAAESYSCFYDFCQIGCFQETMEKSLRDLFLPTYALA